MESIAFELMTDAQFTEFMSVIVPPYVAERSVADNMPREAAEIFARQQHDRLLVDGRFTAGHSFLSMVVVESGRCVGGVWLHLDADYRQAFLYNITVFAPFRRRGYASKALALVEAIARDAGCASLGLNVFSPNVGALALYRKLGFAVASSYLNKPL